MTTSAFLIVVDRHLVPLRLKLRPRLVGCVDICRVYRVTFVVSRPIADLSVLDYTFIEPATIVVVVPSAMAVSVAVNDNYRKCLSSWRLLGGPATAF